MALVTTHGANAPQKTAANVLPQPALSEATHSSYCAGRGELLAWLAQELPFHTQSRDLGHNLCDGNRGDLRALQNSQSDPTTTATAAHAGQDSWHTLQLWAQLGRSLQDPGTALGIELVQGLPKWQLQLGELTEVSAAARGSQSPRYPSAHFPGAGCKLLAQNSPVPSLSISSLSPKGRDHRAQGESAADHPHATCDLQAQPSPPTYLVHSLKSSLEGSCSSLSQQASTSCEGTSGTWSSLWGQRDGVRHREQSTRILL